MLICVARSSVSRFFRMARLSQIIATENGATTRAENELGKAYHLLQKDALVTGISRTYQPRAEDGDSLPGQSTKVQVTVPSVLSSVAESLTRWFDKAATKEWANTEAKADLVVDGDVLLPQVPVGYLLFLDKRLENLYTFVFKLPVLDPAEEWRESTDTGVWVTAPSSVAKTKKVPRNHVKAEATNHHPAQVEVFWEDEIVGDWTTKKFSGAIPGSERTKLLNRVENLQRAVKYAREEANSIQVDERLVGHVLFEYILNS